MDTLDLHKEIQTAKDAAKAAGKLLDVNKKDLNQSTYSSDTDIKLKADVKLKILLNQYLSVSLLFQFWQKKVASQKII